MAIELAALLDSLAGTTTSQTQRREDNNHVVPAAVDVVEAVQTVRVQDLMVYKDKTQTRKAQSMKAVCRHSTPKKATQMTTTAP